MPQTIDEIERFYEEMEEKARARPGEPVRICAGFYFMSDRNGHVWSITNEYHETGRKEWMARRDDISHVYLDPLPTFAACKEAIRAL